MTDKTRNEQNLNDFRKRLQKEGRDDVLSGQLTYGEKS